MAANAVVVDASPSSAKKKEEIHMPSVWQYRTRQASQNQTRLSEELPVEDNRSDFSVLCDFIIHGSSKPPERHTASKLESRAGRRRRKEAAQRGPHPLKKKRRGNPKKPQRKGGTYELRVAKKFAKWYGCNVQRSPRSGGWAGAEEFGVKGDLVFSDRKAVFHCECKNREGWLMTDLITGIRATGERSIEAWWNQTIRDCPLKRVPLLVFTRNRQPDFLMTDPRYLERFSGRWKWWQFIPHFRVENDNGARIVMQLDDFLRYIQPPKRAPNHRTWMRGVL